MLEDSYKLYNTINKEDIIHNLDACMSIVYARGKKCIHYQKRQEKI